ncbi:biotin--protein ligase 1, chloroplastic [Aegilops tauschii subsp. strangulata]|uniref:biotin--protein ligase 1, chloroplastic n=1 Tax=Aegilops tauschii subsp. strangulata TaxID=200361 RepID=UPI003CC8A0DF
MRPPTWARSRRRFGRWMRWSPRMASTHDLVIQNFAKLPVGVVCATYMQFKGKVDDSLDISTRVGSDLIYIFRYLSI